VYLKYLKQKKYLSSWWMSDKEKDSSSSAEGDVF
jgi:hypothetical protein